MTGTVLDGRIIIEGEPLPDGALVTVLMREGNETFHVAPEEKRQLLDAIDQAKQGTFVDAEALLAEIDEPD